MQLARPSISHQFTTIHSIAYTGYLLSYHSLHVAMLCVTCVTRAWQCVIVSASLLSPFECCFYRAVVAMSTNTLLHDLYTLFFSYTQSSIYRTALTSLTTSIRTLIPSSTTNKQPSASSNTLFVESRLQREYGYYSLSASNVNALSHTGLVQLSFVLFVLFLVVIPVLAVLCVSVLSIASSLLVYLTALSTAYVTISTVVYSLVLLQSLSTSGGAQFPLALSSLVHLYMLNVSSFAILYFTMVQTYDGRKGGTVLEGVSGVDGIVNIVHCFYFSISTFTTVGYGDIHGRFIATHTTEHTAPSDQWQHPATLMLTVRRWSPVWSMAVTWCAAVWWVARLFVSLELCLSSLLHVLVFGKGLDLIVSQRTAAATTATANPPDSGAFGGKRE